MDKISGAKSVIPAQAGVILFILVLKEQKFSNTRAGGGDPTSASPPQPTYL